MCIRDRLFTPHWIVRYLVENSLGRLWLLNRPGSRLREHMPYYIEGEKNATGGSPDDFLKITKPEDIRLCDPAVGSGHMLTYAFDLLTLIYEEEGYAPTEIPALILRHNLHGLEICPRAAQLAELALVFKAREKSRRFFQPEHLVRPRIIELRDVRFAENELRDYIHALGLGDLFQQPMLRLLHQFEEAKNFGSLIQPCLDERAIADVRRAIEAKDLGGQLFLRETHLKVLRVLEQSEALTQRYHVVVANPPYMGGKGMNGVIKTFLQSHFADYKSDLFAAFIVRSLSLSISNGYLGFMSPFVWMFISSYEELRKRLISEATITTLVQLEYSGFDGATVPICTFALQNKRHKDYRGGYIRLSDFRGSEIQGPKSLEAIANPKCGWFFRANAEDFKKIPGYPIAYWLSRRFIDHFSSSPSLASLVSTAVGLFTCDNARFIRVWTEVSIDRIGFGHADRDTALLSKSRYFPLHKGGGFRKWYGLNYLVVQFDHDGKDIRDYRHQSGQSWSLPGEEYYFRAGVTWSGLTSSLNSFRWSDAGFIFESNKGQMLFSNEAEAFLGFLNTHVCRSYIEAINPTLSVQSSEIKRLPFSTPQDREALKRYVVEMVGIARADWDNFETSWDFRDQPLLRPGLKGATLEASWRNWEAQSTAAIRRMQELETENNRLFIAAYGLDGELQPEVPEAQITLARAEARRDMAAFLSYAVGCMMGRYSPDHPGLILANAGDTLREFLEKVGKPLAELTFAPDEDGIIPVLDGEWFEDDIVARTRDFLRATFGEATLRENLRFLEDSLGKDLRKYFLNDFYKDHLQTYKKRPIYWLVQSPRKGFSVLLYLHRYTRDTMNLVLNRYLRDYQVKLRNRLAHLTQVQATAPTAREKTEARKEADKLTKTLHECDEWERQTVLPLAQARIELDLDDGVKTNYLKLGEALAPIAGLAAKEED